MKTTVSIFGLIALVTVLMGSGCDASPSADALQKKRVDDQMAQAEMAVPPPRIDDFSQLRDMTTIMERADDAISTYAYYMDVHGKLHFLCEAKGYGLPYSTQTTNPDKVAYRSSAGYAVIRQAEPSGLFMPDNVAATWILCVNPESGGFDAVYWEPDLIVSPFRLRAETSLKQ